MQGSLIGIVVALVVWTTTQEWGWGIGAGIAVGIAWDLWRQHPGRRSRDADDDDSGR
ncbi:hypothetical protein [Salinicola avicenniae]|uniref:hypothetical protein n=1 Tax=Salinicola avicenniae TaxID=2916836 RepID=UPI002073F494|nr:MULTISPECIES: hypothetical protein [unclassified Salinicola]